MGRGTSDFIILSRYIDEVCTQIARKVIWRCQRIKDDTSGDDSGLDTVWDHVCVQVQDEQSVYWTFYEDIVRRLIAEQVATKSEALRRLIWFKSERGSGAEDDGEYSVEDVIDHLLDEYVLFMASEYTNQRIEKYLFGDW